MRTPLAEIVRGFGLEPQSIRLVAKRQNTHWKVRAGGRRYALRRFGVWAATPGDVAWELDAVSALADAGVPVPRPIGGPRDVDGAVWLLLPWLGGRPLGPVPASDADYERLGAMLAQVHQASEHLPAPPQRPAWTTYVDAALPLEGGPKRRERLLSALAEADAGMARRFGEVVREFEARDLPARLADLPRRIVHGDFAPWNIRVTDGRLTGVFDFDLAHVDVRAADVAMARRGYHDAVVRGYLSVATLSETELASLDALWIGNILRGVWRVLESRLAEGRVTIEGFDWYIEQFGKTRPYRT